MANPRRTIPILQQLMTKVASAEYQTQKRNRMHACQTKMKAYGHRCIADTAEIHLLVFYTSRSSVGQFAAFSSLFHNIARLQREIAAMCSSRNPLRHVLRVGHVECSRGKMYATVVCEFSG
jgi:hypothetical protein